MADGWPTGAHRLMSKFDRQVLPGGGLLDLYSVGSGGAVFYVRDRLGNNRAMPVECGAVADCPGVPVRLDLKQVMPEAGVAYVRVILIDQDGAADPPVRCCYWCHRPRQAGRVTCGDRACLEAAGGRAA